MHRTPPSGLFLYFIRVELLLIRSNLSRVSIMIIPLFRCFLSCSRVFSTLLLCCDFLCLGTNSGRHRCLSAPRNPRGFKSLVLVEVTCTKVHVVGEVGEAKEGGRKSEGDMYVPGCGISDQNATPTDRGEWVSGFDYCFGFWARAPGRSRPRAAGAYCAACRIAYTALCGHLYKPPPPTQPRGLKRGLRQDPLSFAGMAESSERKDGRKKSCRCP